MAAILRRTALCFLANLRNTAFVQFVAVYKFFIPVKEQNPTRKIIVPSILLIESHSVWMLGVVAFFAYCHHQISVKRDAVSLLVHHKPCDTRREIVFLCVFAFANIQSNLLAILGRFYINFYDIFTNMPITASTRLFCIFGERSLIKSTR